MSTPFKVLQSKFILLPQCDIDTDQIVPARFMATTSEEGLAHAFFYDARHDEAGQKKSDHVLNVKDIADHQILVAAANFGCGSSREHAVWALKDFGFRAVLTPKAADIFKSNAINNGVLVIEIHQAFYELLSQNQSSSMTIDLEKQTISLLGAGVSTFQVDSFARRCLLMGTDRLGYLLESLPAIRAFEAARRLNSTE